MAQLSDGDSEWRVETVEWDPVEMVVGDTRGAKRASPSRAANTSCQVRRGRSGLVMGWDGCGSAWVLWCMREWHEPSA